LKIALISFFQQWRTNYNQCCFPATFSWYNLQFDMPISRAKCVVLYIDPSGGG
jgi:hypothetical protein